MSHIMNSFSNDNDLNDQFVYDFVQEYFQCCIS